MSASRKRYRPLDPGEERALHTTDALQVGLLDDERSYCFSWPAAPLTAWINSSLAYAEANVYGSSAGAAAAAASAAAAAAATAASTSGGEGGEASSGGPIVTPPVFSIKALLQSHGKSSSALASAAAHQHHNSFSTHEDVAHLLAPFACTTTTTRCGGGGPTAPAAIALSPEAPRFAAHPLAPPRPLCTGEDSIFTLDEAQIRDAVLACLITATDGTNNTDGGATAATPSVVSIDNRKRRRLEWEVVGLEWRAHKESQRTASALQRLLSLEAAVAFEPGADAAAAAAATTAGGGGGGGGGSRGRPSQTPATLPFSYTAPEDWRLRVYRLWLRWRVGPAAPAATTTIAADCGGGQSGEGRASSPARSSPPPAPLPPQHKQQQQQQRHPWGSPLMPGAYLYDSQPDYFLHPARTSAAMTGASSPTSAAAAGRGGDGLAKLGRHRRGPYNFLCWKIEHYLPQLQQLLDANGNGGKQDCDRKPMEPHPLRSLDHPAFAPIRSRRAQHQQQQEWDGRGSNGSATTSAAGGGGGGGNAVLNAGSVDALVRRVVLARPLVEVELDGASRRDRLEALEWADLRRDTDMWRTWLSKV